MRGAVRYPAAYARRRDAWALVVAYTVARRGRRPPAPPDRARYSVALAVYGGGRRDLNWVCTAVLDALRRGGGVLRDDCLVDALTAVPCRVPPGAPPATIVAVATLPPPGTGHGATGRFDRR